jgi:hypothetical protein
MHASRSVQMPGDDSFFFSKWQQHEFPSAVLQQSPFTLHGDPFGRQSWPAAPARDAKKPPLSTATILPPTSFSAWRRDVAVAAAFVSSSNRSSDMDHSPSARRPARSAGGSGAQPTRAITSQEENRVRPAPAVWLSRACGDDVRVNASRPPTVVGLLPARNAAADLPGYFDSIAPVVDAVVALDDGSTDETAEMLAAQPLVALLLRNRRRQTYRGWNDSANRNRLLESAVELDPGWFLFLDSDERLDADDASALRAFIEHEAVEGCAYGMRVFRMIGDLQHWDRAGLWVYRLFARDGDHSLPEQRLHFVPIPPSIPRRRWLQTTIRIQHLAGLTASHRQRRFDKYCQADPGGQFQSSYANLLEPPDDVKPWERRPSGLRVLEDDVSPFE